MTLLVRGPLVLSVLLVSLATFGQPAAAQTVDPAFRSDIEQLLEVTGSAKIGAQFASMMTGQMLEGLKQSQPNVPAVWFDVARQVFDEEFSKAFASGELTTRLVLIYAKHLTPDDVKGLLTFYRSDLGRKVIGVMPTVMQESGVAGQEWGKDLMPGIMATLERRLRAEGLLK